MLVPFAAVLGASAVAAQDSQTAAAGPRGFTTRGAFLAGVVVLATLGTAGTLLARQDSPPLAPDLAIEEGNGFSVRIPPEYAMTHTDEGSDQWLSADGTRALLVFAYALDEPADPLGAAATMLDSRLDAVGSAVVESLEPFEIPGVDALVGRAEGDLASGGQLTVMTVTDGTRAWDILVINFDSEVEAAMLASLRFGD